MHIESTRLDGHSLELVNTGPSLAAANARPLFLDDERYPADDGRPWVIVRTVEAAIAWMTLHGIPTYITFDHDLQQDTHGADLAQWIIDRDLDEPGALPEGFDYFVHSQNTEGAKNIVGKLEGYLHHRAKERGQEPPPTRRRSTMGC